MRPEYDLRGGERGKFFAGDHASRSASPSPDLLSIKIGFGLGDVRFGLTRDETTELLGPATSVVPDSDDAESELWLYRELQFAAGFYREDAHRLSSFEISNPLATLNGERLVGLKVETAAEVLRRWVKFPIELVGSEDSGQLRVKDLALGLWIADDRIESIGWSVIHGADDQPIWPHE